jgi:TolA-binding protein
MENKNEENATLDLDATIVETSHKLEVFYNKNKKNINIAIIAIVVLMGIYFAYRMFYLEPKEREAQAAIFNAQGWFEKDSFNLALNGQGEKAGFLTIADDYGMTKAGNLAHYYAGVCLMKKGDFAGAIDQLEDFSSSNKLLGPMAEGLLGDAYSESGDVEKAVKHYIKAASMSHNKLTSPVFLKKAGLAYESLKKYDDAANAYEKIKKDYFDAPEAQDIDKYIARAKTLDSND